MLNLSKETKIIRHIGFVSGGTSLVIPDTPVAMAGYTNCLFIVMVGNVNPNSTASFTIQGSDSDAGPWTTLAADVYREDGTASPELLIEIPIEDEAENKYLMAELVVPQTPFVRVVVGRSSSLALEGVMAILWRANKSDAPLDVDTLTRAIAVSAHLPGQGT